MLDVSLIDLNALKTFKVDIQKIIDAKITKASTANTIYANDLSGNETNLYYSSDYQNKQWQIVQRDGNNDILVPSTPSSNNAATSKSYVDSNAGTKLYKHEIVITYDTDKSFSCIVISTSNAVWVNDYNAALEFKTHCITGFLSTNMSFPSGAPYIAYPGASSVYVDHLAMQYVSIGGETVSMMKSVSEQFSNIISIVDTVTAL